MKSVAIFCGSKAGNLPIFVQTAQRVGEYLAQQGVTLVYGGGRSGLMGTVADSALQAGGRVIGVIPTALVDKELAHPNLTELHVVKDMHERKTKMSELAQGFIALPGGAGTLEEIFEQWTWAQLGIHAKPCGFLNIQGFYDPLLAMVQRTVETGFTQSRFADALQVSDSIETLVERFEAYTSPEPKWGAADVVP
ncbi:TIGR00730 family Rossman fold protein [Acinetobacter sp. MD2]|uniref:LOG family protein n=1 Tax=Acinetobacter sp. MD2 TaxID=2600066 RepID=UPI002D1EC930|nr:TIGR00730 family Rossman fold protein [Acinetobacter sp. MD2]MEB3768132.1 TIGR00730 family Rossman fold protein [Acinetobacter sp. MD2]